MNMYFQCHYATLPYKKTPKDGNFRKEGHGFKSSRESLSTFEYPSEATVAS